MCRSPFDPTLEHRVVVSPIARDQTKNYDHWNTLRAEKEVNNAVSLVSKDEEEETLCIHCDRKRYTEKKHAYAKETQFVTMYIPKS